MALIPCPLCERQVSEMAASCPQCGHPVAMPKFSSAPLAASPEPTTIEQTSKLYKAAQLAGVVGICTGAAFYVANSLGVGVLLMSGGAVLYGYGRVGAWWNNG